MAVYDAILTAKDLGLIEKDEETLDVLDLPQLYTRPSATTLLSTLADISSEPPSWDVTPRNGTPRLGTPRSPYSGATTPLRKKRKVKSEGLPRYLTNIISSQLVWIENDEEKELIWEAASQRLSERSGRTAMGALTRRFTIPLSVNAGTSGANNAGEDEDDYVEITLHEPALTADNLGLKTWASSYLLAKRLTLLRTTIPNSSKSSVILELGAGTGLVGLAAAAIFKTHVVLTDLPDIVPNLERNARDNAAVIATHGGGPVETSTLDWSKPAVATFSHGANHEQTTTCKPETFPLILVADPIYSPEHPVLLAQAIKYHLSRDSDARVVVELPLREAFGAEREDFRKCMRGIGLRILEEGEEIGFDDWATTANVGNAADDYDDGEKDDDEQRAEVRCWWSVWVWAESALNR